MPVPRAFFRPVVFVGLAMFVVDAISAQVVIRERVEVDAAQIDTTAGLISAPGPVADAWPGGVRG